MANEHYLDMEDYRQRMDNDIELMAELLQIFLEDSEKLVADIDDAISKDDKSALKISAHTLKGSAACISAKVIQRISSELEQVAQTYDMSAADPLNELLKESFETTVVEIRNALDGLAKEGEAKADGN